MFVYYEYMFAYFRYIFVHSNICHADYPTMKPARKSIPQDKTLSCMMKISASQNKPHPFHKMKHSASQNEPHSSHKMKYSASRNEPHSSHKMRYSALRNEPHPSHKMRYSAPRNEPHPSHKIKYSVSQNNSRRIAAVKSCFMEIPPRCGIKNKYNAFFDKFSALFRFIIYSSQNQFK